SWAPFPVGGAPPAARSAEGAPFVFHDAAGRRWPRIKRVVLAAAVALVALIGAVLLAAAHVAPGKAPWFSATAPQPVSDLPGRAAPRGTLPPASGVWQPGRAAPRPDPPPAPWGVKGSRPRVPRWGRLQNPLTDLHLPPGPRRQSPRSSRPSDGLWLEVAGPGLLPFGVSSFLPAARSSVSHRHRLDQSIQPPAPR